MCIHPEALDPVKNFRQHCANNYHGFREERDTLPGKAYWAVRNSTYEPTSPALGSERQDSETFK